MRNKVLILSYYFEEELIGSIRSQGLAKYLPRFGWDPVILTHGDTGSKSKYSGITEYVQSDDMFSLWRKKLGIEQNKVIRPYLKLPNKHRSFVDWITGLWDEIFLFPDAQKNWIHPAKEKARELASRDKFDAIISTAFPVSSHIIARYLKTEFEIPWVADFRDLWSQYSYYHYSPLRRFADFCLEIWTLSKADAITTVSTPLALKLRQIHGKKRIEVIMNGFDPELLNHHQKLSHDKFNIVYTGQLYKGKRDPMLLFQCISNLVRKGIIDENKIEIQFYGHIPEWLVRDIEKMRLNGIIRLNGPVAREIALQKQREAQLLLLLSWNDPKEPGILTGKLFEYLAAKRPIISIGPETSEIKNILESTKAGVHLTNDEEIKEYIIKKYSEFNTAGQIEYHGISEQINKYSHIEMAKRFASILDEIAK